VPVAGPSSKSAVKTTPTVLEVAPTRVKSVVPTSVIEYEPPSTRAVARVKLVTGGKSVTCQLLSNPLKVPFTLLKLSLRECLVASLCLT